MNHFRLKENCSKFRCLNDFWMEFAKSKMRRRNYSLAAEPNGCVSGSELHSTSLLCFETLSNARTHTHRIDHQWFWENEKLSRLRLLCMLIYIHTFCYVIQRQSYRSQRTRQRSRNFHIIKSVMKFSFLRFPKTLFIAVCHGHFIQ